MGPRTHGVEGQGVLTGDRGVLQDLDHTRSVKGGSVRRRPDSRRYRIGAVSGSSTLRRTPYTAPRRATTVTVRHHGLPLA